MVMWCDEIVWPVFLGVVLLLWSIMDQIQTLFHFGMYPAVKMQQQNSVYWFQTSAVNVKLWCCAAKTESRGGVARWNILYQCSVIKQRSNRKTAQDANVSPNSVLFRPQCIAAPIHCVWFKILLSCSGKGIMLIDPCRLSLVKNVLESQSL